jgi:hypothetical protein
MAERRENLILAPDFTMSLCFLIAAARGWHGLMRKLSLASLFAAAADGDGDLATSDRENCHADDHVERCLHACTGLARNDWRQRCAGERNRDRKRGEDGFDRA